MEHLPSRASRRPPRSGRRLSSYNAAYPNSATRRTLAIDEVYTEARKTTLIDVNGKGILTIGRVSIDGGPFGTIKRKTAGGRFLTRHLKGIRTEIALSILAYNILRAISLLDCGRDFLAGSWLIATRVCR
jgi:hypothetical protein